MPVDATIDNSALRHVGIMSVHNLTADWEIPFGVAIPAECSFNPSASGIIFLRWHKPPGSTIEAAYHQIRFFKAADEVLRSKGGRGLDAVVVFGNNLYRDATEGLIIAEGVKQQIDPKIFVLADVSDDEFRAISEEAPADEDARAFKEALQENIIDQVASYTSYESAALLCRTLGLSLPDTGGETVHFGNNDIFAKATRIAAQYAQQFPEIFDSDGRLDVERLVRRVPSLPKGRRQLAWEAGL